MLPDKRFSSQSKEFWANVRTVGQSVGYSSRGQDAVKVPTLEEIGSAYAALGLSMDHIVEADGVLTPLGKSLIDYFKYRAVCLNTNVRSWLMTAKQAKEEFEQLRKQLKPKCPLPMNKQKGTNRTNAYLTGMVNMLLESVIGECPCDYDPRALTTITTGKSPLRTLARRVDGAFPSTVNPIAIWETKEYYYTTTFGSRIADGVYETLLDGMELRELAEAEGIQVEHLLILDAFDTWWKDGKSYLCRIIDMLHMGYVTEVLFGREVLDRLPTIAKSWMTKLENRS